MVANADKCGSCGKEFADDEPRYREPGWEKGDLDCAECWKTWPMRARAALDAKKERK